LGGGRRRHHRTKGGKGGLEAKVGQSFAFSRKGSILFSPNQAKAERRTSPVTGLFVTRPKKKQDRGRGTDKTSSGEGSPERKGNDGYGKGPIPGPKRKGWTKKVSALQLQERTSGREEVRLKGGKKKVRVKGSQGHSHDEDAVQSTVISGKRAIRSGKSVKGGGGSKDLQDQANGA